MAFESLSDRLTGIIKRIRGQAYLTEANMEEMLKEIRVALLEADVNFKVVKEFINKVKEKALGQKVFNKVSPGQMLVKIVHDEIELLLGSDQCGLNMAGNGPTIIMMCGLQGSGKTTHAAKIANYLRKNNNLRPLLIAADVYRPAAINQLVQLGKQLDIEVFELGSIVKPQEIVRKGIAYAKDSSKNLVIIDTAGRLQIDEVLMQELVDIKDIAKPDEILLTIDAMTGQDAVNVASSFHEKLDVTGCLLTKLDSDTRGGAALSIRYMTQIPIKFIGVGEKLDQLEVFHPDRMAKRILGMGDVIGLIEKPTANIDEDDAMKMAERLQKGIFTYNDFLDQIKMIKKMGSLKGILGMLPGMGSKLKNLDIDEKQFTYIEVAIGSMTKEERKNPDLIATSYSRKMRIAKGSGRPYQEINALTKRFEEMRKQMLAFAGMSEEDMEKAARRGGVPMKAPKVKKGKGTNKGGFRF